MQKTVQPPRVVKALCCSDRPTENLQHQCVLLFVQRTKTDGHNNRHQRMKRETAVVLPGLHRIDWFAISGPALYVVLNQLGLMSCKDIRRQRIHKKIEYIAHTLTQ